MVEANNVIWDVCDSGPANCLILGNGGFLDEFDYSIVDKNLVAPGLAYKWGITSYFFSYVLTYDTTKFGTNPPKSWKDFYDLENFPGKRTMWKNLQGVLEAALMADGVPADPAKLYPIDVPRALEKIKGIKQQTIFYTSGAQQMDLLQSGECSMGMLWHTRATTLFRETNGRFDWTWNQGFLVPGTWLVPKGNPAGKDVYRFIRSAQIPERQIALLEALGNGPANPAAAALVPPELKRFDPSIPENARLQVTMQPEWYYENQETVSNQLFDMIAG
jgi:putative spermidine/putrescine transport system substrate-binding protein